MTVPKSQASIHPSNSNQVRILQWNCHSINNKIDSVKFLSQNHDIFAFSETWLFDHAYYTLPNFNILRRNYSQINQGGLILAIRGNLPYNFIGRDLVLPNKMESIVTVT